MSDTPVVFGSMKLFTASGVEVVIPLHTAIEAVDYANFLRIAEAATARALTAGWLASPPGGLEAKEGEEKEEIGYVLRRTQINSNKSQTPLIDLYSTKDMVRFKVLSEYLNEPEDVKAFEQASGLRLSDLREFPGTAAPKRGASPQSDAFIVKAPRPFHVIHIPNPDYDPKEAEACVARNETYKVAKRKLLRWVGEPKTANAEELVKRDPPKSEPPKAAGLPANGQELHRRLHEYDSKLAAQKLCSRGELLAHVARAGVKAGYSANIAEWSGPALPFAVEAVKGFEAEVRKKQGAAAGPH